MAAFLMAAMIAPTTSKNISGSHFPVIHLTTKYIELQEDFQKWTGLSQSRASKLKAWSG
jgi:hypothetical protein